MKKITVLTILAFLLASSGPNYAQTAIKDCDFGACKEEAKKAQNGDESEGVSELDDTKEFPSNLPNINTDMLTPLVDTAREMELFQNHLNRVFSNSIRSMMSYKFSDEIFSADMDLEEYGNNYIVRIDLPGFKKESLDIEVQDNRLYVSGERDLRKNLSDGVVDVHISERRHGRFQRTIALPSNVQADRTNAKYENGVLIITIPKSPDATESGIKIPVK